MSIGLLWLHLLTLSPSIWFLHRMAQKSPGTSCEPTTGKSSKPFRTNSARSLEWYSWYNYVDVCALVLGSGVSSMVINVESVTGVPCQRKPWFLPPALHDCWALRLGSFKPLFLFFWPRTEVHDFPFWRVMNGAKICLEFLLKWP